MARQTSNRWSLIETQDVYSLSNQKLDILHHTDYQGTSYSGSSILQMDSRCIEVFQNKDHPRIR
jgi:hypothetical protein